MATVNYHPHWQGLLLLGSERPLSAAPSSHWMDLNPPRMRLAYCTRQSPHYLADERTPLWAI